MFWVPTKIFFRRFFLSALLFLFFLFPLTNLAIHEIFLSNRFGNRWEFWLHGLTSILIYLFYSHYILTKYKRDLSFKAAIGFGILWAGLFLAFFLFMAIQVFSLPWLDVMSNFNVFDHELLPIVVVFIAISPASIWQVKS